MKITLSDGAFTAFHLWPDGGISVTGSDYCLVRITKDEAIQIAAALLTWAVEA